MFYLTILMSKQNYF